MSIKELKVNYKKLLNKADNAKGRKETVSYLNRAAKLKSKIYSKTKINCTKCNGVGYLRTSIECGFKKYLYFLKPQIITPTAHPLFQETPVTLNS